MVDTSVPHVRRRSRREAAMRWRLLTANSLVLVTAVAIAVWTLHRRLVDHWVAVHTGVDDVSGVYYGFWSGFGSDLAEFGIIGAIGTALYQVVRKYNCHEPGCWRVGTHPAAGGQFMLCYRHHPDFQGRRPTHDLIARLHQEDAERRAALHELHTRLTQLTTSPDDAMAQPAAASEGPRVGSTGRGGRS
jgi:hypothetical protein